MSATPVQVRGQQSRPDYPMAQGNQGGFNTKRIATYGLQTHFRYECIK